MLILVFAAVFVPMVVEAARARRNERAQRGRGGIEPAGDVYGLMRVAYPGAFAFMLAERALCGAPSLVPFVAGAAVFASAKALKWWAILALGPAWTFRVIVVPGARLVTHGPYRLVRHPNYVAVVGELVGVALMTGALIMGPLGTMAFIALIVKRIAVEERAVDAILQPNLHQCSRPSSRPPARG